MSKPINLDFLKISIFENFEFWKFRFLKISSFENFDFWKFRIKNWPTVPTLIISVFCFAWDPSPLELGRLDILQFLVDAIRLPDNDMSRNVPFLSLYNYDTVHSVNGRIFSHAMGEWGFGQILWQCLTNSSWKMGLEKSNLWWNNEIFMKNPNLVAKSKFWWKIKILLKHRNFREKSKFCWKIQILLKHRNFCEKSKFCWKIEILLKNPNFVETSKFSWKIQILLKNPNFDEQSWLILNCGLTRFL